MYNLNINGNGCIEELLENRKLIVKDWKYNNYIYKIIRYNKEFLKIHEKETLGLFRSVIINNENQIVCFSPPKSFLFNEFKETKGSEFYLEEFIEGTMINVFFDKNLNEWEIATKSSIGGEVYFNQDKKVTFKQMWEEVCKSSNFNMNILNKEYCYSFVLQHIDNKIVIELEKNRIFLIGCYKINGLEVEKQEIDRGLFENTSIEIVKREIINDLLLEYNNWSNDNIDFRKMGVVIYDNKGKRCKIINQNYELVKNLRGNYSKNQYRYLNLRREQKLYEYLRYFPEDKKNFTLYKEQLHRFTNKLYTLYIDYRVLKKIKIKEIPYEYKPLLVEIHDLYLNKNRIHKKRINRSDVINYINNLPIPRLMYSINYSIRNELINKNIE